MICLATDQGLGYLARDFYKNGLIDYVYIHEHSSRKSHKEWYSPESVVPTREVLLEKSDIILGIETFFDWKIIPKAREKGKKTVLIPMYECTPFPLPYQPDLILTPSDLDQDYYPEGTRIIVPVDTEALRPRIRSKAEVFVHNAGNGGLGGRNGTAELLEALQYVSSPIKLILRSQVPLKVPNDPRIDYREGTFDDIWDEGDVFVFPEKFNGLSLPLQEAFASGMAILCGDRHPMNKWLPGPFIPVDNYTKERIAVEFSCAQFSPKSIALAIDKLYNTDISAVSKLGITWGKDNSWEAWRDKYQKLLRSV